MSSSSLLFLLTVLLASAMPLMASSRPLAVTQTVSNQNLASRLNLDEESSSCWDSLLQIHACSGEVVMFFFNGETYLGHSCCEAIQTIEHQCWPALLGTLGFTTEETNVLKGYCDRADQIHSPPSPPSPPSVDLDEPLS